jgi:hypothetical protein
MTTGIYQLIFSTGDTYVGQARNITDRYAQHIDKMRDGNAANKMQLAYFASPSLPDLKILLECHEDYLNVMEMYYIVVINPSLNTVMPKLRSTYEVEILLRNKHMLIHSPAQIIDYLAESQKEAEEYKVQYKALKSLLNEKVEKEIAKDKLNNKIQAIMKRNLWQRILNRPV